MTMLSDFYGLQVGDTVVVDREEDKGSRVIYSLGYRNHLPVVNFGPGDWRYRSTVSKRS